MVAAASVGPVEHPGFLAHASILVIKSSSRQRQVRGLLHQLCVITAFEPGEKCRTTWFGSKHLELHGAAWTCCVGMWMRTLGKALQFTFRKHGQGHLQNSQQNFVPDESHLPGVRRLCEINLGRQSARQRMVTENS